MLNRLSFTAMEKAAALVPLHAGFIPNSTMPMLDMFVLSLLGTISITRGGTG